MTIETNVQNLKINTLTQAQYNTITPSNTELYMITDSVPGIIDQTYNPSSANAQSGVAIAGANFAKKTTWISKQTTLYSNTSFTANNDYTPSLGDYLPNENAQFEVLAMVAARTANFNIDTDVLSNYAGVWCSYPDRTQVTLVMNGSSPSLTFHAYENCTEVYFYLRAYRKIG